MREDAQIQVDRTPRLLKGVTSVKNNGGVVSSTREAATQGSGNGTDFNSNRDGIEVVQGEEVTYRLDVTAPFNDTTDYLIWAVLPKGIKAGDVKAGSDVAKLVEGNTEGDDATFTANVYDEPYTDAPQAVRDNLKDNFETERRSVMVFEVTSPVPASSRATPAVMSEDGETVVTPAVDAVERGLTLGYTVVVPDGVAADSGDAALVTQKYDNDASIVRFGTNNNGGGTSTVFVEGSHNVADAPAESALTDDEYLFVDTNNDTSDDSGVYLPDAEIEKILVSSQIDVDAGSIGDGVGLVAPDAANNAKNQIVQGEFVTFDYTVTIPANTSVKGGRLVDLANWKQFTSQNNGSSGGADVPYFVESVEYFYNLAEEPRVSLECGLAPFEDFDCEETLSNPNVYGALLFPEEYQNSNSEDEEFTARITMWMEQDLTHQRWLENTARFDYIDANAQDGTSRSSIEDSERVQYIEPNPSITKAVTEVADRNGDPVTFDSADPIVPESGSVTYTLTASNTNNRPALFDGVIYDCVPDGLLVDGGSFVVNNGNATDAGANCKLDANGDVSVDSSGEPVIEPGLETTLIKWELADPLVPGTNATLSYTATVDPDAGGGQVLRNGAHLRGYTIPANIDPVPGDVKKPTDERRDHRDSKAREDVRLASAGLTKTVSTEQAPVGETVTYTLTTRLPAAANYYDVELWDELPVGLEYVDGSAEVEFTDNWPTTDPNDPSPNKPAITDEPNVTGSVANGQRLDWTINPQDIGTFDEVRTITVTLNAKITAHADLAASPRNTAYVAWNDVNGDKDTRHEVPATADVMILNPEVNIEKKIDTETPIAEDSISVNPDQSFDYELRVFQTSQGNTPAHNVTVVDNVPAGVIIDTDSLTVNGVKASSGQVELQAGVVDGAGGTITWSLAGPLNQLGAANNTEILLGYSGGFIESTGLSAKAYKNYVNVTSYESYGDDGWVYTPPQRDANGDLGTPGKKPGGTNVPAANDDADVTPLFPQVDPVKTVSPQQLAPGQGSDGYGLAYVDTDFNWTLTITNNGAGVANAVDVIDTLPVNWDYVDGSVAVNGVSYPALNPAEAGSLATGIKLTWSADDLGVVDDLFPLAAGDSFVITFDAQPTEDAIDVVGTGLPAGGPAHTNTVAVDNVTDADDNERNLDVDDYAGSPDTADAYIAEADLKLEKVAIGGIDADLALSNGETLPVGTWVPGATDSVTIGGSSVTYAQPQWQLTVNNYGPDASFGAFVLEDTQTLPTGVEVLPGGWSARYYSNAADTVGTSVNIGVVGEGTGAAPYKLMLGDNTTSLSAGPKVGGAKTAGEDRIVVTADVSIAAGALATGNELMNVADVVGQTFERDSNQGPDADNPNVDEVNKPLESAADLAIVKTVATDAAELGAGKPVSWDLQGSNHGPSTSLSGTQKIEVSDVIPDGISGVTDPSNATWLAEMSRTGDATATWPAQAGDEITWTYLGAAITPGQTIPVITLSGWVNTDWEGEIENVAVVTPGDTPDPHDPNNEDEVPFTPDNGTTISIDKTRVVKNATGDWVAAGDLSPVPAPVPGEDVSYRITVTNHGPAVARSVHVTDELESYLSFVSKEDVVGTWSTANAGGDTSLRFNLDTPAPLASPVDLEADDTANEVQFILTTKLDSDFILDADATVFNEAVADADNADPVEDDDNSNTPSRDARLTIVKTHSGDPIAGTSIPYTLTVTNKGPSASRGPIEITDALPAGLSYVADSATVSVGGDTAAPIATEVNADGDVLAWSVGDATDAFTLPVHSDTVNGTIVITLNVLIDAEITNGEKQNTATVDGPDGPPDEDTDEIVIEREADMSLTKQVKNTDGDWVDEANVVAGDEVEYLLTVTNEGPSANPANLIDELPTHLTLVSVTPLDATTGWDCSASVAGSQLASCTNPLVPVGTTEFMVVTKLAAEAVAGEAGQAAEFVNEATLSWFDRDSTDADTPNTSEDDAKITATAEADLVLQKRTWDSASETWVDAASATAGEQTTYRVDVRNDGPSDVIAPLGVTDLLPAGVTFNALRSAETLAFWEAAPGVVDVSTGQQTVVFTPNDANVGLKTGESLPPLRYTVDIDPAVAVGDTLVNLAVVTSGTTETDDTNNSDIAEINVERQIDLGIVKTHDADVVRIGDVLPFTIDVTNHGPSEASGIVVTDEIPAGLEAVSDLGPVLDENGDPTGWQIDSITLAEPGDNTVDPVIPANPSGGATVVASYAHSLAPDESAAPLVINTLVTPGAYETVTNVVKVAGNEPEPDPDTENPNRDEDPVVVPPQVTLVVKKTAVGDWQVGKNGSYEIKVENLGPTADPGPITVTDVLPNGLGYVDSPNLPAGVTVATSGKTVTWIIENGLAVDASVMLQLTVHVAQAAYPDVTNVVVIDSQAEKTPESVLQDDETVAVAEADPLVVTGGDLALGVLTAAALLLLLGGATYAVSRRNRSRARYGE